MYVFELPDQVEDLARLSFRKAPLYVGVDDRREYATAEGIEQVTACNGEF